MTQPRTLERAGAVVLMAAIGIVCFNLLAAQVLFGVAAILWVIVISRDAWRPHPPAFAWPLLAYAGLTAASALLSAEPARSVVDLKQLLLFLMVPMVLRFLTGPYAMRTLNVVIAIGAAAALLGVVEYAVFGYDNLNQRPVGSLTHYMTYSGVIMLILSAAVARLLYFPQQIVWPAVAVPALVVALGATNTRGAWIGAAVAVVALVAFKRPRLLLFAPVVVALVVVVAPPSIRSRAVSIVDRNDPSNLDRLQMIEMGIDMVRDRPWFGVGPDMVGRVYGQYLRPNPVHTYNPHLHNVPVQIAAERGVPALLAWLAFVATAAWGLVRRLNSAPVAALAASGLGAIVAMLTAGLFEYNFGDSEFLMLFLALVTLPFAGLLRADGGTDTTPRAERP